MDTKDDYRDFPVYIAQNQGTLIESPVFKFPLTKKFSLKKSGFVVGL